MARGIACVHPQHVILGKPLSNASSSSTLVNELWQRPYGSLHVSFFYLQAPGLHKQHIALRIRINHITNHVVAATVSGIRHH